MTIFGYILISLAALSFAVAMLSLIIYKSSPLIQWKNPVRTFIVLLMLAQLFLMFSLFGASSANLFLDILIVLVVYCFLIIYIIYYFIPYGEWPGMSAHAIKKRNFNRLRYLLQRKDVLTKNEIEQFLGVSSSTAVRYFDELESKGYVKQIGKRGSQVKYKVIAVSSRDS